MSVTERKHRLLRHPPSGKFKQHEFQRDDIAYMAEYDASANWSEMGAMKTTTAEWLWELKTRNIPNPRILVVTTKSGKGTYFESIHEVLPEWEVYTVNPNRTSFVVGTTPVPVDVELPSPLHMRPVVVVAHYHCFTNKACIPAPVKDPVTKQTKYDPETGLYEMTTPKHMNLLTSHWDMVVIDEAHRIKNRDAQWTVNLKKIKCKYKHAMTGTGFINNPAEIWSILNWLFPDTYTSFNKFKEHYCDMENFSGYEKIVGIKPEMAIEFKELVKRIGVRRTMVECFPDIQEPIETVIPVGLNTIQRKMYDEIKWELLTLDQKGEPLHSPNVLSALNRLRQIAVATPDVISDVYDPIEDRRVIKVKLREPSSKLDALMEVLEGLEWDDERRDQVVVFSNFKDPIELAIKRFQDAGISYLHMHTGMNDQDRYKMWHDTWPKKEHQVFICTLMIGSESINLTSAQRAIFLDQSWSPKDNTQAIGRVYRPGQTGVTQLIYIRATDTVDYKILGANEEKMGWFRTIFGNALDDNETEV